MPNPLLIPLVVKVIDLIVDKFAKDPKKNETVKANVEHVGEVIGNSPKSKTIWFAVALTVVGSLQQTGVLDTVPVEYQGMALAVVGLVTAVLRYLTNRPVSEK